MQRQRNKKLKDYSGMRFGRLVAISLVERDWEWNDHLWKFRCDCGAECVKGIKRARSGNTSSCGCLKRDCLIQRNTTHGLCRRFAREYRSWKDMRARCLTVTNSDYPDYGGRGIKICHEWNDFAMFVKDMGVRPRDTSLDRIDVNGDYEPANCRWASSVMQANNKRSNNRITINNETRTLQEWSDHFGVRRETAAYRLREMWPLEEVFQPGDFRR